MLGTGLLLSASAFLKSKRCALGSIALGAYSPGRPGRNIPASNIIKLSWLKSSLSDSGEMMFFISFPFAITVQMYLVELSAFRPLQHAQLYILSKHQASNTHALSR